MRANSNASELNSLEDIINRLESGASALGRQEDIVAAKAMLEAARDQLAELNQSILRGRNKHKDKLVRHNQFETACDKLLDWLHSLETRLDAGIFADGSYVDKVSLRDQLKELENITIEYNGMKSEIEAACGLLDPSECMTSSKLAKSKKNFHLFTFS